MYNIIYNYFKKYLDLKVQEMIFNIKSYSKHI